MNATKFYVSRDLSFRAHPPQVAHDTLNSAAGQAQSLAKKCPSSAFYILQIVGKALHVNEQCPKCKRTLFTQGESNFCGYCGTPRVKPEVTLITDAGPTVIPGPIYIAIQNLVEELQRGNGNIYWRRAILETAILTALKEAKR